MRALVLLALVLPAFAGCIADDEPTPVEAAGVQDPPHDASDPAPASPEPEADPTPAADEGDAPERAAPGPTDARFAQAFDGLLEKTACVPAGPDACVSPLGVGSWHALDYDGAPSHATLTLSWEAASPVTESLGFVLVVVKSCGDGCKEGKGVGHAEGASPLTLDADVDVPDGAWLETIVYPPRLTPSPVYGMVTTDQPYKVEGEVVALVPASA